MKLLEDFFTRQVRDGEDSGAAWDRMAREIKGSIFTLLALFELVSLTSYIPIDSFNLFDGRIDHMNNMGGIVGAAIAEWFLGTVGVAGYSLVLITIWLGFCAFRGGSFRENIFRVLGTILGTLLAAITLNLLLSERTPEMSMMQGGFIGRTIGSLLKLYLNTTGALLLVGGAFIVTLILTTGLSITRFTESLFSDGADDDEAPAPKRKQTSGANLTVIHSAVPQPAGAPQAGAPAAAPAAKKPRKKPSKKSTEFVDDEKTEELDLNGEDDPEKTAELDLNAAGIDPNEFREMIPYTGSYSLPSARLLKNAPGARRLSKGELKENARKLCEHLLSFQVTGEVVNITQGPVVITYEFKPSAGVKLTKIAGLQDDLGIVLGTRELRVMAPIPGKTVVGFEVPRTERETISLKEVLGEKTFYDKKLKLPVALGKSTDGVPVFGDLAAMPHLLVAGSTGSGKSVFVNSLITSFLYRMSPQELRMILVDPKMLELNVFDGLPHLLTNVITDNNVAINAVGWAVTEMDRRYKLMADSGSKNLESYNGKMKGAAKLPFIVIVVDEMADLMMSGGAAIELSITRLAQKARAAGIHLVLATQRPSTDVVTGLIKANIPSRLAFKVPSAIDSRTVLDASGADELIGRGDSLMIMPGIPLRRIHGTFLTEDELARVVKYAKGGKDHSKYYIQFSAKKAEE